MPQASHKHLTYIWFRLCVHWDTDNVPTPTCYKKAAVFSFYVELISCRFRKRQQSLSMATVSTFPDWVLPIVKQQKPSTGGDFKILLNFQESTRSEVAFELRCRSYAFYFTPLHPAVTRIFLWVLKKKFIVKKNKQYSIRKHWPTFIKVRKLRLFNFFFQVLMGRCFYQKSLWILPILKLH